MRIEGIITAMVTPLNEHQEIDEFKTRMLVDKLIAAGVHGLFILGTNGEFYALSEEEKLSLAKIVVNQVNGKIPVYAGSGGTSTQEVIHLSNKFYDCGVNAVSVITPYLMKFSEAEVINHYKLVAKGSKLPIILYNIPANTGINISLNVFEALVNEPNIIGIKDSSGNMEAMASMLAVNKREDFSVLVGSDSKILTALKLGAQGAVAATSNVLTKTDIGIYNAFTEGDFEKAQKLQLSIDDFRAVLKLSTVPSVLKRSLALIGYPVGEPKLPVLPVSLDKDNQIQEALEKYREIEQF